VQVIVLQAVRHRRCGQLSAPVVVDGEQALEGEGFLTSQPAALGGTGSEFVEQPPILQGQLRGTPVGNPSGQEAESVLGQGELRLGVSRQQSLRRASCSGPGVGYPDVPGR
jgi:hypothetical protein